MVKATYISADQADLATAQTLGIGFVFEAAAAQPHIRIERNGQVTTLPGTATAAQVAAAMQPLLDADAAGDAVASAASANADTLRARAAVALAGNVTYLALAAPSAAQTTAQVKALTRQMDALIRLQIGQLADISDA